MQSDFWRNMFTRRIVSTEKFLIRLLLLISQVISIQIIPERPEVTYWNREYIDYMNITARRASRREPVVINIHGTTREAWGNNITVNLVFYEFLSNMYKPSFVELHYKLCNLVQQEKFIGRLLYDAGLKNLNCPYPAETYALVNMTFHPSNLPSSFPFTKGRVNISVTQNEKGDLIACGLMYITVLETPRSWKKNRKN